MNFVVSASVVIFGFLFLNWAQIELLAGRRTLIALSWLALGSMYLAFTYRPDDAMDIVTAPINELIEHVFQPLLDDITHVTTPPPSTTPTSTP